MQRKFKNIFVKVSGDLLTTTAFVEWVRDLMKNGDCVVIGVGGGSQISNALDRRRLHYRFNKFGRVIRSFAGRLIAEFVLKRNQKRLEDLFAKHGVRPRFFVPVFDICGVTCHANGDEVLAIAARTFDVLYVATIDERAAKKSKMFRDYRNIKIKTFPRTASAKVIS